MPIRQRAQTATLVFLLVLGGAWPRSGSALNELAASCQLPTTYLTETGLERLLKLGVTQLAVAFLNPVDDLTSMQKKKIKKAAAMFGGGVFGMTVCPPLIVEDGFSQWEYEERLQYAIDTNFAPIDIAPMDDLIVDEPANENSCQASVAIDIDGGGKVDEGLDFPELEFVYVDPFGSFPNGLDIFNEVLNEIRDQVLSLLNQYLINLDPIESGLEDIGELTDLVFDLLDSIGLNPTLDDFIPGLKDFILDLVGALFDLEAGCDSINFECDFRLKFDRWQTNLLALDSDPDNRIFQIPGGFSFPDGPSDVGFVADINTGFSQRIGYVQDLFVTEFFAPNLDVLFQENGFNVIADFDYEALEPGQADLSYTQPKRAVGKVGADDVCDPRPRLLGGVPGVIPIQEDPYFFEVGAIDRTGNQVGFPDTNPICQDPGAFPNVLPEEVAYRCERYAVKVLVEDTIPPDIQPKDPIGIEVAAGITEVAFIAPEIGCVTINCQTQIDPPIPPLQPPPTFDFATNIENPENQPIDCTAANSLGTEDCATAMLPVGEVTTVTWGFTDGSGNRTEITQLAALREEGTNQPPVAEGTSVTVAQNEQVQIELVASDPEFDPLRFAVDTLPMNGTLEVEPEAEFQTRFVLTGTITDFPDIVRVAPPGSSSSIVADIFADPVGKRLVGVIDDLGEVLDSLYFEAVRPDSIALREGDFVRSNQLFGSNGVIDSLLIGDWGDPDDENRVPRIHGLVAGTNSLGAQFVPDAGFDLSGIAANPAHFEFENGFLFVTDPDPDDPTAGKLHVIELGSPDSGPASWSAAQVRTIDLGFNGFAISRTSPPTCGSETYPFEFVLGDWDGGAVHLLDLGDSGSPVNGGTTEPVLRTWDVSAVLEDPDGPDRPDIGNPQDFALLTDNCRGVFDNLGLNVVDDFNKDIDGLVLEFFDLDVPATPGPIDSILTEFARLFGVEALGEAEVLTLERQRLARFDLQGNLLATVLTAPSDEGRGTLTGAERSDRLIPIDDTPWADFDVDPGGNVYLFSFGQNFEGSDSPKKQVVKVQVARGSNNFTLLAQAQSSIEDDLAARGKGRAIAFSTGPTSGSGDDSVYLLQDAGMERFDSMLGSGTILFEVDSGACSGNAGNWCPTVSVEFPDPDLLDIDTDAMGDVYLSDLANQRVHKFMDDGTYVGWLGRCDGGPGCDIPNGRSIGFTCSAATCTAATPAGTGQGQFSFRDEFVDQDKPRVSSGILDVNGALEQIYVSDNPDFGAGPVPRIQIFSLDGGFVSETLSDLLTSTDAGNFTAVNDVSTTADTLFVIEDEPLKRLHLFDINPFAGTFDGALVTYLPNPGFSGFDSFSYVAVDSFRDASAPGVVNIEVLGDMNPPTVICPADITGVEGTETGGARRSTYEPGDLVVPGSQGSVALRDFFAGVSFSDDIDLPPPALEILIDGEPGSVDSLIPANTTTTVTFRVRDGVGNTDECTATVEVVDTIPPSVNAPPDVELEITGDPMVVDPGPFSCTDIVGAACVREPAFDGPVPLDDLVPPGTDPQQRVTIPVTYTATDGAGNQAVATQTVVLVDSTPPTFEEPSGPAIRSPDTAKAGWPTAKGLPGVVAAINGFGNPYAVPTPAVNDAGGIDGDVVCQPELTGTAAAVPLEFYCQVRDVSGNIGDLELILEIAQLNGDGDPFADLVDPRPAVTDATDTFSDAPLGGTTSGTYTPDGSGGSFRIIDALEEPLGVRAEWIAPAIDAPVNGSVLTLCDGTLSVRDLAPVLDTFGDEGAPPTVDVSAVSMTCGSAAVRNHLGTVTVEWLLPNGETATVLAMPDSHGLSFDGFVAVADPANPTPLEVIVDGEIFTIEPGETIDVDQDGTIPVEIIEFRVDRTVGGRR